MSSPWSSPRSVSPLPSLTLLYSPGTDALELSGSERSTQQRPRPVSIDDLSRTPIVLYRYGILPSHLKTPTEKKNVRDVWEP